LKWKQKETKERSIFNWRRATNVLKKY